jgi:hypothetical protein
MRVSLKDLREAFEFVCASGGEEHQAFLCQQSGKLYYHSELGDDLDSLPDDIDDGEKFLPIPTILTDDDTIGIGVDVDRTADSAGIDRISVVVEAHKAGL